MLRKRSSVPPLCRAAAALWLVPAVMCLLLSSVATAQSPLEYEVKAAFLLNFTKFVEWPRGAFPNARSPISICILGHDPFGRTLDDIVHGEAVNGRSVAIRRIAEVPPNPPCQVIYVDMETKDLPRVLAGIGPGVLTVGEGGQFAGDGGIVGFLLQSGRVRFVINQAAAESAGLKLSSRLLSVAVSVHK